MGVRNGGVPRCTFYYIIKKLSALAVRLTLAFSEDWGVEESVKAIFTSLGLG